MNIEFVDIKKADLEILRFWRMKENVTKYLLTDPIITREQQIEWFNKVSLDDTRKDYIIVFDSVRIGYYGITNIDYDTKSCEIGFYIGDDNYRGKGYFKFIHSKAEEFIFRILGLNKVMIEVFEDNPIYSKYLDLGFVEKIDERAEYNKNGTKHVLIHLYKTIVK